MSVLLLGGMLKRLPCFLNLLEPSTLCQRKASPIKAALAIFLERPGEKRSPRQLLEASS